MKDIKQVLRLILGFSMMVFAVLIWFIYFKEGVSLKGHIWVSELPAVNAGLNFLSAVCLVMGIVFIKQGKKEEHKKAMISALMFSTFFLISYLIYHYFHGDSRFMGQGLLRPVYFFILISHIVLTIAGLPLILSTAYLGLASQFESHKKWARWTFPIWLYISVTGVMIYIFLRCYS